MSERTHAQANLDILTQAADAAEDTPRKRERMRAALERYAQARLLLGRPAGDGAIDPIEPIGGVGRVD